VQKRRKENKNISSYLSRYRHLVILELSKGARSREYNVELSLREGEHLLAIKLQLTGPGTLRQKRGVSKDQSRVTKENSLSKFRGKSGWDLGF